MAPRAPGQSAPALLGSGHEAFARRHATVPRVTRDVVEHLGSGVDHAAANAAATAGVRIEDVGEPGLAAKLASLFVTVWDSGHEHVPMSPDLICALAHTGQYVVTAGRDGALVGGTVGFITHEDGSAGLHSHITAVLPSAQGQSVGLALKLHQRAWAQRHGLRSITWTFDPLIRRNAYFNLTKLGARARKYRVNAYGEMRDGINAGEQSDRYVAEWPLDARPLAEPGRLPPDADVVLHPDDLGAPVHTPRRPAHVPRVAWIPQDIVELRRSSPELAHRWRVALRDALVAAMDDGFVATAMTRDGWYVLERAA